MATPPLPDNPSIRARLIFSSGGSTLLGNRLFFNYEGSAPSGPNCTTIAGDIAAAVGTHMVGLWADNFTLDEVDVLDISTEMGASGQWTGSTAGTRTGNTLPDQCATNVEFGIAERYRGGKPRIFLPPGCVADMGTTATYNTAFIDAVNATTPLFFEEVEALTVGSTGPFTHVCLSYYKGVNTATPPWRGPGFKYPPKYRSPNAVSLPVTGYFCKAVIGSQRRRRTSTTA